MSPLSEASPRLPGQLPHCEIVCEPHQRPLCRDSSTPVMQHEVSTGD